MKLDKLEAMARAATPGPWHYNDGSGIVRDARNTLIVDIAPNSEWVDEQQGENADFIAASNPAVVLKLIALLREFAGMLDSCQTEMMEHEGRCRKMDALGNEAAKLLTKLDADLDKP